MALEALIPSARQHARLAAGVFVCIAALLVSGCAALFPQTAILRDTGVPEGLPAMVDLKTVPFFAQKEYECGPASLAMVLNYAGAKVTAEELVPQVYLPARQGSLQVEMLAAARRHGMVSYQLAPRFGDVLRELGAGNPVIVLQNFGVVQPAWHYAVAIGYDYDPGQIILHSGEDEHDRMYFFTHEFVWRRSGYWSMVVMPPDKIPATADEARWLSAVAALERVANSQKDLLPRARTAYDAFLKRWPRNVNAAVGLANTHYALGDLRDAERVLRNAAAVEPDSPVVLNNLAQTLSDLGRDAEALPVIERAAASPAGKEGPFAEAIRQTRDAIRGKLAKKKN